MASYVSLADDLGSEMVTIYVGAAKESFLVHKNLLVARSSYFKGALTTAFFREAQEGTISFEDEDPAAFRLLIAWLYQGGRIPRLQSFLPRLNFSINQNTQLPRANPPLPTQEQQTPVYTTTLTSPQDTIVFSDITAAPGPYHSFSLEEIRLAYYNHNPSNETTNPGREASSPTDTPEGLESVDYHGSRTTKPDLRGIFTMKHDDPVFPMPTDYKSFMQKSAEYQLTLLKLLILAEKLCWDDLFNAAMNAFIDGEDKVMNRAHIPDYLIEMAYEQCHDKSPVRRLIVDMVHSVAKTSHTHWRYSGLVQKYNDFLVDLFKRLDHQPGDSPFPEALNPLKTFKCKYHMHGEREEIACFGQDG